MRRKMTKEVTKTTVKVARTIQGENGLPQVERLEDVILLGNVDTEKAQKLVAKRFDFPVTVYAVQADTEVYQMDVERFIELAELKTDENSEPQEDEESASVDEA
jgi:hypothetical protein